MGLLDKTTQQEYYQGSDLGNYQFTSLQSIINQFMVAYVGENKMISKIKRVDVAFHAKRALQELSFDTFKSCKAYEIVLPPTLQMILPQDYVNYIKLTWSDSVGIEHIIYPASKTSNPLKIIQQDDGDYDFGPVIGGELITNGGFDGALNDGWTVSKVMATNPPGGDSVKIVNGQLAIETNPAQYPAFVIDASIEFVGSRLYAVWQEIDVTNVPTISISAVGTRAAAAYQSGTTGTISDAGFIAFGISTQPGSNATNQFHPNTPSPNNVNLYDLQTADGQSSYISWDDSDTADTASQKQLFDIDVSAHNTVYAVVVSEHGWNDQTTGFSANGTTPNGTYTGNSATNYMDDISVMSEVMIEDLQTTSSETWSNYKSNTPNDNIDKYNDDTYDLVRGERYGLDPQYAQTNGSFYIDCNAGKIHFSSNLNGENVILKYLSDGLGTDKEMQVHKFAEDAMYKHILCDVMSAKANVGRGQLMYYKKDKFAAVRKAKLRLSNIKLEELTQILRGKSKWIKH